MRNEIEDELYRTLRQIGPATIGEVVSDVRGRVRLGLLMLSRDTDDLVAALDVAWRELLAAGAIEAVGDSRYLARPLAAIASGPRQIRLFV